MSTVPAGYSGETTGTTAVYLAQAPASSATRLVSGFSIKNTDTVAATVTVTYVTELTTSSNRSTELLKVTLQPGDLLIWSKEDPTIVLNYLQYLTAVLSDAVTTNELEFTISYTDKS